jgi:hypothetical protein
MERIIQCTYSCIGRIRIRNQTRQINVKGSHSAKINLTLLLTSSIHHALFLATQEGYANNNATERFRLIDAARLLLVELCRPIACRPAYHARAVVS